MSFGGGNDDAKKQRKFQNAQVSAKYAYDLRNYEYLWGIDRNGNQLKNADGTKQGTQWENYYTAVEGLELKKQADQETKAYQEETADQNWEMGKSQQQYQWDQQDAVYEKNQDQYVDVLNFNQIEYNDAVEREKKVLDEQFISSAFQNQSIISDLYESTGSLGYDQAANKLGLLKQEDLIESQKAKQLINLKQNTASAKYKKAGTQIDMLDQAGRTSFQQAGLVQDLFAKESDNRFKKASLLMDVDTQDQIAQFQNDAIRRENKATYAKAAHESTERNLQALQAQGQAALTQSGRSQGKAVQMVLAELGRQQSYIAETLVRGSGAAEARMKQNLINATNVGAKAALSIEQIGENTGQNIEKTLLNLEETERNLKLGNAKGELNLDQIRKQVFDNIENTSLDVKTLENNLKHTQTDTGLKLKKIDWDLDNLGSRFTTNQDVLKATLDSAVTAAEANIKDITRAKQIADLRAEAQRMLDPSKGRDALDLDYYKPIDLPEAKYQDPLEPKIPPAPIRGAMMDTNVSSNFAGAAVGGITAGLGAISAASAAGLGTATATAGATGFAALGAAGPIGLAVGALSFLSAL